MECRVLRYSSDVARKNIALEQALMEETNVPLIRFWKNPPTVVVGRTQDIFAEVNLDYCGEHRIEVNRRMSSGGAVYQDLGNLNVSFVLPRPLVRNSVRDLISSLSRIMLMSVSEQGFDDLTTSGGNIYYGGKKVSGSAQHISAKWFLHHATLLIHADLEKLEHSLLEKSTNSPRRGASRYWETTNLHGLDEDVFSRAVVRHFCEQFSASPKDSEPSGSELERCSDLVRSIYSKEHWIFRGKRKAPVV